MSIVVESDNAASVFEKFISSDEKTQTIISEEAKEVLSGNQYKKFKNMVKEAEKQTTAEDPEDDDDSDDDGVGVATPGTTTDGGKSVKKAKKVSIEITAAELQDFWKQLEKSDFSSLIEASVIADFQYVGFNPDSILKTILTLSREAGKNTSQTLKDISTMCTIAVMKGSVTDANLKKMSDSGKRTYGSLETLYKLKRGGSKGLDPEVVTIARVGAAFPGAMMQILLARPELTKKFSGPFGSKALPPSLRHQCAAAAIPDSLDTKVKDFLIGLITAYTADQSKVISKSKDKAEELYDRQENFINQTQSSSYPSEDVRKTIFRRMNLQASFDDLMIVATNVKKVVPTFNLVTREEFDSAISRF